MERLRKLTTKEKHLKDQIEREGSMDRGEVDNSDRKWRSVGSSGISSSSGISAGTFTMTPSLTPIELVNSPPISSFSLSLIVQFLN